MNKFLSEFMELRCFDSFFFAGDVTNGLLTLGRFP